MPKKIFHRYSYEHSTFGLWWSTLINLVLNCELYKLRGITVYIRAVKYGHNTPIPGTIKLNRSNVRHRWILEPRFSNIQVCALLTVVNLLAVENRTKMAETRNQLLRDELNCKYSTTNRVPNSNCQ
jgi:hypothetical protein